MTITCTLMFLALLAAPVMDASACSCATVGSNPPCQAAWGVAAVFTGTVVEITEPSLVVPPQTGASTSGRQTVNDPRQPQLPWPKRIIRMKLGEAFTGVDPAAKEVEIATGRGGGDCGYPFEAGVDYVVYAYRNPEGKLETGICNRTRALAQASEDVAYFHSIAAAPPTGEIRITTAPFGLTPVPGVTINVEKAGSHYTLSTNAAGEARLGDLPPGEYKVRAELDGYFPSDRTVQLHSKGCAEVPFFMALDRRISGIVTTKEGLPAAGVEIQVVRPGDTTGQDSTKTDAEGRFELRHFRSGGYHLGVNLDHSPTLATPYTRWFYPGTEDAAKAAIIYFSEAPETKRYYLRLPERQNDRVFAGTVRWPDGRPAPGVRLFLADPRWPWREAAAQVAADANGRFVLHGFDGTTYRLHAVLMGVPSNGITSAEPVVIQPGTGALDLQLVLTQKGNSFDQDRRKGFEQLRNQR
ncbi:MAG TPA: carboxypeptidase regulatory-like domain-containing protein [Terriglobia bacterium]|nr:carboxypeptidase regulatory-like domain-containing protein [Terriglobia bacterium]